MENTLAERINNSKLTNAQVRIANYFLKNQSRICTLSSMEAAKEIGVSDASIIRFARAIGYAGFADLKEDFYNSLVENAYSGMSLVERMNQSKIQYPSENIYDQYLELMQRDLVGSLQNNSPEKYEAAVTKLLQSRKRYVIGLRGCRGAAAQFSRLLGFMLPNVQCISDSECVSINALQDAKENDALLMYAFARYYKIDLEYMKLAKKLGVKIILITDEPVNPLIPFADIVLQVETEHMSFFNSTIGAIAVSELLLTELSRKVDFQDRIQTRDEITKSTRL